MSNEEYGKLIDEINALPSGGITYKKINGKKYAYYQWREGGKQRSRRIKDDELTILATQIERRKEHQNQVKGMEVSIVKTVESAHTFHCVVRIDQELERFVEPVSKWVKRECYKRLHDYVYGDVHDRVYILYGLRRTGKTTFLIHHKHSIVHKVMTTSHIIRISHKISIFPHILKDITITPHIC